MHDRPYLSLIEQFDPDGIYLRGKIMEHVYLSAMATSPLKRIDHLRRAGAYLKHAIHIEENGHDQPTSHP